MSQGVNRQPKEDPGSQEPLTVGQGIYEWAESLVMAIVCVVLIFTFVARLAGVSGVSMMPTLHDKDWVLVNELSGRYHNGDIVVVLKPTSRNEPLIKRVIATEGQMVDINFDTGEVRVDGELLEEPYINEETHRKADMIFPKKVPDGHVFVMGDNRNNSWDSRDTEIGMIDNRYILGKVSFRMLPAARFGMLK